MDIRVSEDLIIRDRFDWGLNELHSLSPAIFARILGERLNLPTEIKEREIQRMADSILDQIFAYIEKNTFFPRTRFSKREEEIIAEGHICVNCNALLQNTDNCSYCGFSFEKKLPIDKRMDDIVVPIRQTSRQRSLEEAKKRQSIQQQALTLNTNSILLKEPKKCNYCSKINPFFRIDCADCGGGLEKK